jgi:hypothetical protein
MNRSFMRAAGLAAVVCVVLSAAPVLARASARAQVVVDLNRQPVALTLNASGIYRVSGAWLLQHGVNWSGMAAKSLAVTYLGKPVARSVSTKGVLGDSSTVEFYAPGVRTMYTSSAMYVLSNKPGMARQVARVRPGASHGGVTSYQASVAVGPTPDCSTQNGGCIYEPMAPGDKWFYGEVIANGGPSDLSTPVRLDHVVTAGRASLSVDVWGVTDFGGTFPQHDVQVLVNGHHVLELKFSGSVEQVQTASFPAQWLVSGANRVRILLPGTVKNQYDLDITDIREFSLSYPRALEAQNGSLAATLPRRSHVTIGGFDTRPIRVWSLKGGESRIVGGSRAAGVTGDYSVSFTTLRGGEYIANTEAAELAPSAAMPIPPTSYLTKGKADLLVIAPRTFWPALEPLVAYHEAHGLAVKLADVQDVFDRYGHAMFDANALRAYISQAIKTLGIRAVLLVGVDSYDYHHFLDCSSLGCSFNPRDVSLVPSLYSTDSFYGQIPSDELLVDVGGVPRIAIGRIPAVNATQVRTIVSRTLAFMKSPPKKRSAVMVAGTGDPGFATTSDALAAQLPPAYTVTKLDQPAATHKAARDGLLRAIGNGTTVADFVGHGNLEQWDQDPVLSVGDVKGLKPHPAGQLYFGWGCQTAYDVDPTDEALNARLLFRGGGVLTLGSTGLDLASPQSELAQAFFHEVFQDPGTATVGQALLRAEITVYSQDSSTEDPIRSYEIFGDPMLPVSALR